MWIIARGFRHEGWVGCFYPEDLPPEWRLSYYANEFDGLLLRESEWRGAGEATLRGWREDTPPGFRFFLETAQPEPAEIAPVAACLGDRLGGVVARSGPPAGLPAPPVVRRLSGAAEPRLLRTEIEALRASGPGAVLVIEGEPPDLQVLRAARVVADLLGA